MYGRRQRRSSAARIHRLHDLTAIAGCTMARHRWLSAMFATTVVALLIVSALRWDRDIVTGAMRPASFLGRSRGISSIMASLVVGDVGDDDRRVVDRLREHDAAGVVRLVRWRLGCATGTIQGSHDVRAITGIWCARQHGCRRWGATTSVASIVH